MNRYRVGIVTVSDKGAAGQREDLSGPAVGQVLAEYEKYQVTGSLIISDDKAGIVRTLAEMCDSGDFDLVLTTGGTGFSMRDNTPEATMEIADRNAPGIAEYMRAKSFEITPRAMLSRGVSVIRGRTLIVNLPGSPKAARENLGFIMPSLDHGLDILLGRDSECGGK